MTSNDFLQLTDPHERIDWLVGNSADLPAMPKVAVQVTRLVDDKSSSATLVAKTLSTDQVLTARLLKMANSAYYGAPRRVSTVTDAIVLLGMRTIRDMAMAVSCQDLLGRAVTAYAIRRGDLWRHSLCVGFAAQHLARKARYQIAEEAFVAGLLHDIGKVLISLRLSDEFAEIHRLSTEEDGMAFHEAERKVLGFDHAQVGARMAELWNLPPLLVSCIRYHHEPASDPEKSKLTSIVHLADVLCMMLGIGLGEDGLRYSLAEGTLESLHLDEVAIESALIAITEFATSASSGF